MCISSDNIVIEAQAFTQEIYCRYQLLHIWEVAFHKVCKLGQFAVSQLVSVCYLLYVFRLLLFPLSGFFLKF